MDSIVSVVSLPVQLFLLAAAFSLFWPFSCSVLRQTPNPQKQPTGNQAKPPDTEAEPGDHLAGGFAHRNSAERQEWAVLEAGIPPDEGRTGHSL